MRARARLAAFGLVLLGVASCGESSPEEPHEVVEAFLDAYADADGEAACKLLAEDAQAAVEATASGGCASVVERLVETFLPGELRERLREAEVRPTSAAGDRAVVTATLEGTSAEVVLRRDGGEWLIADVPRFTGE